MKIRFKKDTNIRSDNQSLDAAPIGVVFAQTLLEVEDEPQPGISIQGDNRWWRDKNGWFYWAGETELAEPVSTPTSTPNTRAKPKAKPKPKPPAETIPTPSLEPELPNPPVEALDLVALPVPDDLLSASGQIPDGEWRLVRDGVSIPPENLAA